MPDQHIMAVMLIVDSEFVDHGGASLVEALQLDLRTELVSESHDILHASEV